MTATERLLAAIERAGWRGRLVTVSTSPSTRSTSSRPAPSSTRTRRSSPTPGAATTTRGRSCSRSGRSARRPQRRRRDRHRAPGTVYGREREFQHRVGRQLGDRAVLLLGGGNLPPAHLRREHRLAACAERGRHPAAAGQVFNAVDPQPTTQREYLRRWRAARGERTSPSRCRWPCCGSRARRSRRPSGGREAASRPLRCFGHTWSSPPCGPSATPRRAPRRCSDGSRRSAARKRSNAPWTDCLVDAFASAPTLVRVKLREFLSVGAAFVFIIALPVSAAVAHWVSQPDVPGARQEVSYVQVGGKLYLAGGGTAHQKFDPPTNQWTNVAPLPANIDHIQGVAVGGKIYYIGGLIKLARRRRQHGLHLRPRDQHLHARARSMPRAAAAPAAWPSTTGRSTTPAACTTAQRCTGSTSTTPRRTPGPSCPTCRGARPLPRRRGRREALGDRRAATSQIGATTTVNDAYRLRHRHLVDRPRAAPDAARWLRRRRLGDEIFVIGGEGGDQGARHGRGLQRRDRTSGARWRRRCRFPATASRRPSATAASTSPTGGTAPGLQPEHRPPRVLPGRVGTAVRRRGGVRQERARPARARTSPTTLQFGPDGRLYVAQQNGVIKAYTVPRTAANNYAVTATETINVHQQRCRTTTTTARSTRR